MSLALNLAAAWPRTEANGPGLRAAVWVQGCTLRCPGCFNAHTHPHEARQLVDPEALARSLLTDSEVRGLTILGGEPFEQAAACAVLAEAAKALSKDVMVYSGYEYERLRDCGDPAISRLLAATDLLCCGPFIQAQLIEGQGWRGSANQRLILLNPAFDVGPEVNEVPLVELRLVGQSLDWTGPLRGPDWRWLRELAARR
ncbi:radical SAM protein [Myxococcota bacterium]|nr:radical SAM protein [Myxococcota bacterium]MBU1432731.1 radical SAM protein [Myxococcota bacterium]MBU1900364.1 radical SAM protein [Myxococcota bacterium]